MAIKPDSPIKGKIRSEMERIARSFYAISSQVSALGLYRAARTEGTTILSPRHLSCPYWQAGRRQECSLQDLI